MTTTTTAPVLDYRLDLVISEPNNPVILQGRACYRMTAVVEAAFNMPAEIFVHQRSLPIGVDGRIIDEFIGVAGPYDLVSMSDSVPDEKRMIRKNCVSMLMTTPDLAKEFVDVIRTSCQELVDSISRLDSLHVTQQFSVSSPIVSSTTT